MARKRYTIVKRQHFPGGWSVRDNKTGQVLDDHPGNRYHDYGAYSRTEAIEWAQTLNRLNSSFDHDIE